MKIKKLRPLFTKILVTMNKYEADQKSGKLIDTTKLAGTVKDYQTVVAVGQNSAGIKEGDVVVINPKRYAVMKHKEGSLQDGVITDNPVIGYNFPVIEVNGVDHMLLDTQDIEYVIEEFEEETITARAAKAGLYTPDKSIIS